MVVAGGEELSQQTVFPEQLQMTQAPARGTWRRAFRQLRDNHRPQAQKESRE